jgi:SAM-dependent methyltransferase
MIETLLKKHLQNFHADKILDVGPGYGDFAKIAAQITGATEITFIDCDERVLSFQSGRCRDLKIISDCCKIMLDTESLRNIKSGFDLILCQEVLEHLANAEEILSALAEKLAPNGKIVITTPTKVSERLLKFINPNYMKDEPFGHVREFDKSSMTKLLDFAGLKPLVFLPTQPQYFIAHVWLFGSRMKIEGSTGRILTGGVKARIFNSVYKWSDQIFRKTGPGFWGRVFPRNYFVVATRKNGANSY